MAASVRVEGAREVIRAFRSVDRSLAAKFGADLKKAADPVVESARGKVTRYAGASVSTIRSRRSGPNVYVEQGARKVTGRRGDFGALQMRTVLEPALDENEREVFTEVNRILDGYAHRAGF